MALASVSVYVQCQPPCPLCSSIQNGVLMRVNTARFDQGWCTGARLCLAVCGWRPTIAFPAGKTLYTVFLACILCLLLLLRLPCRIVCSQTLAGRKTATSAWILLRITSATPCPTAPPAPWWEEDKARAWLTMDRAHARWVGEGTRLMRPSDSQLDSGMVIRQARGFRVPALAG